MWGKADNLALWLLHPPRKLRTCPKIGIAESNIHLVALEVELQHEMVISGDTIVLQNQGLRIYPGTTDSHEASVVVEAEAVDTVQPDRHTSHRVTSNLYMTDLRKC